MRKRGLNFQKVSTPLTSRTQLCPTPPPFFPPEVLPPHLQVIMSVDLRKARKYIKIVILVFFLNFYLFIYLFIYLFLAVLGLRFCARAFSRCGKRGPLFIAVRGPLTIVASLVAEHRLQTHRLSSCCSRA